MVEITVTPMIDGKPLVEQKMSFEETDIQHLFNEVEKYRSAKYKDDSLVFTGVTIQSEVFNDTGGEVKRNIFIIPFD